MMRVEELLDALATGRMSQRAIESLVTAAGRAFAGLLSTTPQPPKKSGPFGVVSSTGNSNHVESALWELWFGWSLLWSVAWSVSRGHLTTVPGQPTEATPKILMTAHETH